MANGFIAVRRRIFSAPMMHLLRGLLPEMSETEQAALEAGSVWWEGELFAGNPDWSRFRAMKPPRFSEREQAFLDGPVAEACAMIDNWDIEFQRRDLPREVWSFFREKRFFGMIIPEKYDGLEFSAYAHSEVVKRLSTRSVTAAVTVMVPNSLGPGELLLQYGTEEQKERYLPRLARGEEVPCFALTGEDAGSDASAMTDEGVVCYGEWKGERVLGMRLNWQKRYITLGPVATLMGLAFKLRDPEHLLGQEEDLGITVALIPTALPGIEYGHRHYPSAVAFQNGPLYGHNVFVPLDHILGGRDEIGQGWKMLMGALAAGRGISLPSLSTAGVQLAARTTGAYARIRRQFNLPVGRFEGVREALARIAGSAYLLESARRFTMIGLDEGEKPAVVSAIMKYHATERMRGAINDAMDVHGGKTICEGPKNYLGTVYRAIPIGITVEGANILTRSMIIFGQGAIRCHPWLTKEMRALADPDRESGLKAFDRALSGHLAYQFGTIGRAFWRALWGGRFAPVPADARELKRYYRGLARYSAALALVSEATLGILGGALKRRESLSARLGDVLSELYLLSAVLRRYEDDGRPREDVPFVRWCFETGLYRVERRLHETLRNLPGWFVSGIVRMLVFPTGRHRQYPSDKLMNRCAELIQEPGQQRDRLTAGVIIPGDDDPLAILDRALLLSVEAEDTLKRLDKAGTPDPEAARRQGLLSDDEVCLMKRLNEAVQAVIEVDDFAPDDLTSGTIPERAVAGAAG